MRFRPRIEKAVWLVLSSSGVLLVLQLLRPNNAERFLTEVCTALFLLGCALAAVAYRSMYWELSPRCLLLRTLWKVREIPWNEITRVGWLGNMSGTFSIGVGHRMEDYDRLYIEPSDQAGFIAALRGYAPHATFELEPFEPEHLPAKPNRQ